LLSHTDPPPAGIYTRSLHDALPISPRTEASASTEPAAPAGPSLASSRRDGSGRSAGPLPGGRRSGVFPLIALAGDGLLPSVEDRSEEHTSELQSRENLVCRLLLEKK